MKKLLPLHLTVFLLLATLPACESMKKKEKPARETAAADGRAGAETVPDIADQSGDVSYQAFLGRLRAAIAARDHAQIASMMTSNFGYRLEPLGEGDGVFQYWDENNLWPELEITLNEDFAPKGAFMVGPKQFADDPDYRGYRAGLRQVNGSWRFAYFVSG